jgi:hypothetical protein
MHVGPVGQSVHRMRYRAGRSGVRIPMGSRFYMHVGPAGQSVHRLRYRAGRSGDRIPMARFSAPVQTGTGSRPASCTMGTGSFPGLKSGRGVLLTTQPLLVPCQERVELYLYPPSRPSRPVTGLFYHYVTCITSNTNILHDVFIC